jgi:hypothetical protein
MAKKDSGGGLTLNKNVRPSVRTGSAATGVRPGYPDLLGNMRGSHVTDGRDLSAKLTPMQTVKPPAGGGQMLGNQKALDVGKGGPGTGRVVMATGSQKQYGAANPGERKPISGPDPLSPWFGNNNSARRSPVKR